MDARVYSVPKPYSMEDGINEFLKEIVLDSGTRMSLLFLSAYTWSALFRASHICRADFVIGMLHAIHVIGMKMEV